MFLKRLLFGAILCASPLCVKAQTSESSLSAPHQSALEVFVSDNESFRFMAETEFTDRDMLQDLKNWDADFKPFYAVGDLTGDGRSDFALLLYDSGVERPRLVIFNQIPGGSFYPAFVSGDDYLMDTATFIASPLETGEISVFLSDGASYYYTATAAGYEFSWGGYAH